MDNEINGILIVDKQKGMTSHDVVNFVRRRFKIEKAGHAGTLDPNATGVLVLLLGKATKLSDRFLTEDKKYKALMKLGEKTDTCDSEGNIICSKEVNVSKQDIENVFSCFRGEITQIPPMYSARRVNGKHLYELARKGIEIERKERKICINELKIENIELPFVSFQVVCSKGTYIRQLADDIGEKLGCYGHLAGLRRLKSGMFTIEQSVSFQSLSNMDRRGLDENIIRIQEFKRQA